MERYERNINAKCFSIEKQKRLINSKVLVVGAGGLGSSVLQYLTAAGVRTIGIVEYDTVSITNLQRQVLYSNEDLGKHKGEIAKIRLMNLNPSLKCEIYNQILTDDNGVNIVPRYDIIVDCTDNYESRYTIDRLSKKYKIPFVYGSAEELNGQVATFNHNGCIGYSDLFPESGKNRKTTNVLSPIPGIVGSIQALEVIKILTDMDNNLSGKLLTIDGDNYTTNIFVI